MKIQLQAQRLTQEEITALKLKMTSMQSCLEESANEKLYCTAAIEQLCERHENASSRMSLTNPE